MFYSRKKTKQIFSFKKPIQDSEVDHAINAEDISSDRLNSKRKTPGWDHEYLKEFGQKFGFLKPLRIPQVVSVFVTKGGVLKTSLTLNMARMAALHGVRTCVVGLDMQCDVTTALGHGLNLEESEDLESAIQSLQQTTGLYDYFQNSVSIDDLIVKTDLPGLNLIPETPELMALDQALITRPKREYWLKEKVIEELKERYDLILLDGSPNWNQLTTNALVACDLLVSPLECKVNNFRNFHMFQSLIEEFKQDLQLEFKHHYVATKYSPARKLAKDIFSWYREQAPNCNPKAIRESIVGEEATAMNLSIVEYQPSHVCATEFKEVLFELWSHLEHKKEIRSEVSKPRQQKSDLSL